MPDTPIQTHLLSARILPGADPALLARLGAPEGRRSLGILTTDCDDVSYTALDEATKKAAVQVVYARSMYAGASNASPPWPGNSSASFPARTLPRCAAGWRPPSPAWSGTLLLQRGGGGFGGLLCPLHPPHRQLSFPVCPGAGGHPHGLPDRPAPGSHGGAGRRPQGRRRDPAGVLRPPPTETNFAGGLLTGQEAACRAACEAFAQAVRQVALAPADY